MLGISFGSKRFTLGTIILPKINQKRRYKILWHRRGSSFLSDQIEESAILPVSSRITVHVSVTAVRYGVHTRNTHIYEQLFGGYASFRFASLNEIIILLKTVVLHIFP